MLLQELFAEDIDLSEYDKKLMVNIHLNGEDDKGTNVKSLYALESNPSNLRSSKEDLEKYKLIEETSKSNFYIITDVGYKALNRASIVDDNNYLIETNASKDYYSEPYVNMSNVL